MFVREAILRRHASISVEKCHYLLPRGQVMIWERQANRAPYHLAVALLSSETKVVNSDPDSQHPCNS